MFHARYLILLTALVCALPPRATSASASASGQASYLGGTVKSIPEGASGTLDLTDPAELQFKYAKQVYRVPYASIRGYHVSNARAHSRSIARLPMPRLLSPTAQVLDLSYKDQSGGIGTVSFRLTEGLSSAEWLLSERIESGKNGGNSNGRVKLADSWWGDEFWKTNRNKAAWPEPQPDTTILTAGTK